MAKLTAGDRKGLPSTAFALPGQRKYPVNDAAHAGNAKARASAQVNAGKMSASTEDKIDAAADKKLKGGPPEGSPAEEAMDKKEAAKPATKKGALPPWMRPAKVGPKKNVAQII